MNELQTHINKQALVTRRRFRRLDDGQRERLERAFSRHVEACRKSGVEVDRFWLFEAVWDVQRGIL